MGSPEGLKPWIFIPFSVGGGIASVADMRRVLLAGAEKISVNSQAVKNPSIIEEGASIFGRQCIVLGMDAARDPDMPSGYRVFINGGRTATELDALAWAKQASILCADCVSKMVLPGVGSPHMPNLFS